MKSIYLEPAWKLHSLYSSMINNPPEGYQFIVPENSASRAYRSLSKFSFSYSFLSLLGRVIPVNLLHSYLGKFRPVYSKYDLTYASNHIVFRNEPWIIDMEYVSIALGMGKHLGRYKSVLERSFESQNCKGIICWYEACKKTLTANLDCSGFENKITVFLPYGQQRKFTKQFHDRKIKIFFLGSANILGEFFIKGGVEAVESFIILNKRYDNLELVIRSDVPQEIKARLLNLDNVKVIDKIIPWEALEQEFQTSDIFLLPAHNTPWLAMLDGMSYELPVVTLDVWANPEIVENGRTGFLVPPSGKLKYFDANFVPQWDTPRFQKAIKVPDQQVVNNMVEKIGTLIENPELRRSMGKAGRWEIEHGKFSMTERNDKLKKILDEALI